ncbi:hypothetical protein Y032_0012g1730 [Ancylostoma ceylanicum]|uniref:Uncharacterized protein n=1 Tax=Ancylostoma ceylanicum TaxID=53326 RepID=A0A016VCL3_9BILA|nr:hypothetical protein Y032_0012g1730 [Ancylostoma ceylanicum]
MPSKFPLSQWIGNDILEEEDNVSPRRSVSAEGPTPTRPRLEVSERTNNTSSLRTSPLSSTLFDASETRQTMNRFVECPYSNAVLENFLMNLHVSEGESPIRKFCASRPLLEIGECLATSTAQVFSH